MSGFRMSPFRMSRLGAAATAALASLALLAGCAAFGPKPAPTVERMYVLDCGINRTNDLSRWSPGFNQGRSFEFSNNCYLIRHANGWMLWDSGIGDEVNAMPNGQTGGGGAIVATMPRTLLSQLQAIGVPPEDVTHAAFSHSHSDHVGNANYFVRATIYMQEAEYDAVFGTPPRAGMNPALFSRIRINPIVKLKGDHDVFGDGSVRIISTPGHTPGHQSLLVRLPRRGPVILTGDAVHFQENWVNRRVPAGNFDQALSRRSMERLAAVQFAEGAELWINHDKAASDRIPRAPRFVQ